MTKQMNVNVLKSLMNQSGWTHEQVITIITNMTKW